MSINNKKENQTTVSSKDKSSPYNSSSFHNSSMNSVKSHIKFSIYHIIIYIMDWTSQVLYIHM